MAPTFIHQSIDTRPTQMACATFSDSNSEVTPVSLSYSHPTHSFIDYYRLESYNKPKKEETLKERKIRERAAFKMFYKIRDM